MYQSQDEFKYVEVYEFYCGSLGVKFSVAFAPTSTALEQELESMFEDSLDIEGHISDSVFKVLPGTTIEFQG